MIPDWVVYCALFAVVIVANVIGFSQGYRYGVRQLREATHIRLSKRNVGEILNAVTLIRSIDTKHVHWTDLPRFLRRDAQEQEWAARRRRR